MREKRKRACWLSRKRYKEKRIENGGSCSKRTAKYHGACMAKICAAASAWRKTKTGGLHSRERNKAALATKENSIGEDMKAAAKKRNETKRRK